MERSRDAYSRGFLSTLSLRRATSNLASDPPTIGISIHALLAESDHINSRADNLKRHISIHALLAESDVSVQLVSGDVPSFLSTLSLRRATIPLDDGSLFEVFLSTLSLRRATIVGGARNRTISISIHALLAESDLEQSASYNAYLEISIHALLAESDSLAPKPKTKATEFLSTLSLRRAT